MFAALVLLLAANPLQPTEPVIDAGHVRIGPPLARRFAFTNTASETLTITDVRSSCGCMAPALAKRIYAPGERGELTVEVNTLSQPAGPHHWAFTLQYRCGDATGEQSFELTADLMQEIQIVPAAIAFRGDGPLSARISIHDPRPKPFAIRSVDASMPGLTAIVNGYGVEVRVRDDCPHGRYAATVTIATDDPDYSEIKLPVTIDRKPKRAVIASPNRVTVVPGGTALVQILCPGGDPIEIESIEPSISGLPSRWAAGPGNRATVRIGVDRAKWDGGSRDGEVRVRLKVPAGESLVIPVAIRPDE
jgi:hypothetical protein